MKAIRRSMVSLAVGAIIFSAVTFAFAPKWKTVDSEPKTVVVTIDEVEQQFGVVVSMPSIEWVQRRLGCSKVDGKLGDSWKSSETQRLWDLLEGNKYASQYSMKTGRPKD